jgi:hypothetical protein
VSINKNFVVKNGFEVATNLVFANADTKKVGIGSTNPERTLDVRGGIGATDLYVIGVATATNQLHVGVGGTTLIGIGGSVGIGTAIPSYLLDIRSPVSTGQTALYVKGDVYITGDLTVDDITFDDATLTDLTVTNQTTSQQLTVSTATTTQHLKVTGVSTFVGFSTFNSSVYIAGITTFANYAQFLDSQSLYFGNGADLNIYHDGSNSYIQEQGQGSLYIQSTSGSINIRTNSTENAVVANQDGSVELYYDNAKKFETLGVGASVSGTLFTNQLNSSGIATASAYYIDGTSIISNSKQLQNISSLDATTTATIEAAIANAPNTFTDLTVTGITTLGTVKVSSGIITATSGIVTYYGDGSYLTGNARNLTATIGIRTEGAVLGYGVSFLDLRGAGVSTAYYNSAVGIATIFFQGGGGSGGASIGIGTTPGEAGFPVGVVTAGNLWYNSSIGRLFIYYNDGSSSQWVDAAPFNVAGTYLSKFGDNILAGLGVTVGAASTPSVYFTGDATTGFFSPSAGNFNIVSVGSTILNINSNGIKVTGIATATDFDALSDINYKENIVTVSDALSKVDQLRGVRFDWKESGLPSYGVIAQELQEVLPELVHGNEPKTVNYNGIIGVLIEAIKELKVEVEDLKNQLNK